MKPLFILLTVLSSFFVTNSHATDNVSADVMKLFQQTFVNAKEATWTVSQNHYKVEFLLNDQTITAFYSHQGEFIGVTRNISSLQLPIMLQTELKKEFAHYWISELFELSNQSGAEYYVTVENADSKIVLKASGNSNWTTYQKSRK